MPDIELRVDTFLGGMKVYITEANLVSVGMTGATPSQLTADQNNYVLTAGARVLRMSSDAERTLTGLVPRATGDSVFLINVGSNNIVLANQSASSTAAYRIISPTIANLTLGANEYAFLWYDDTTARWRILDSNGD